MNKTIKKQAKCDGHRILDGGWLQSGGNKDRLHVARGSSFTLVVFVWGLLKVDLHNKICQF